MALDVERLRSDLQALEDDLRERVDDYTGVMYYHDGDREIDLGRRYGYEAAADELGSLIIRHFGE